MRHLQPWAMAVAGLVALALAAPSGLATSQVESTATAVVATPSGPTGETLIQPVVIALPPPPAFIRLARNRLEPGGMVPLHTHPGPEFGWIESGVLTVEVEREVVVVPANVDGTPRPPTVPPVGEPFDLGPGDRIIFPAEVPLTLSNRTQQPTTLLSVVVLPAGPEAAPAAQWVAGTPHPDAMAGVSFEILGDAIAYQWPAGQNALVLDRLILRPGDPVPGSNGPAMIAVVAGEFRFSRIERDFQVSSGQSGPRTITTIFVLKPGESVFFANGMGDLERPADEPGDLELLRFAVVSIGETPAATAAPPAATTTSPPPLSPAATAAPPTTGPAPGAIVVVTEAGVLLRDGPTTTGAVVADLALGRQMVITGPPVEGDGIIWYPVQAADDPNLAGYIAEEFMALAQ